MLGCRRPLSQSETRSATQAAVLCCLPCPTAPATDIWHADGNSHYSAEDWAPPASPATEFDSPHTVGVNLAIPAPIRACPNLHGHGEEACAPTAPDGCRMATGGRRSAARARGQVCHVVVLPLGLHWGCVGEGAIFGRHQTQTTTDFPRVCRANDILRCIIYGLQPGGTLHTPWAGPELRWVAVDPRPRRLPAPMHTTCPI